jgi:nucleoside-diphosphate-sugar epimerase
MSEVVAVLGANGVYARHLLPRLTVANDVIALARRPEAAGAARACGVEVRAADIFDTASMTHALEGCSIAINLATTLPGPSGRGDFAANDRLRVEGVPNFLEACRVAGVARVVQQSIGFISASGDANWSDEDHVHASAEDTIATRAIAAGIAMEDCVRVAPLDWAILRGGLFYGPGTGFDDGWFARAATGKLRLPGDGNGYVSLIHIADMAIATIAALRRWPSRQTLIVCDDRPVQWRELLNYVSDCAGGVVPQPGGQQGFPSFRLSNARAKAVLGWAPSYPTYREGLAR